jgi:DNA polymerase-1
MSSSKPNLQNIPKKQMYRSCFVAPEGYKLITADMSGAELRILGNLSQDPIFIESYANGIDLHSRTASETFGVPMDRVSSSQRDAAKALNFGLCYGLSKFGLARRLKISEKEADSIINNYFARYRGVKRFLDQSAKDAVYKRYSRTVSGRKRFYRMPPYTDPNFKKIKRGIERQAKNAGIQGANADTIKQSMIYLVDRLAGYDARLISTVHDEVIVEVVEDQVQEVSEITVQALKDGFGRYFTTIPMESDALVGDCWLKDSCEIEGGDGKKCKGTEMKTVPTDDKYGTKVVCQKCGGTI